MKVELELWQLITLLLTFLGACAGGGKLLLNQIQKSLDGCEVRKPRPGTPGEP
ncbi:hypothetical protein [Pseudomonas aeruginosa]|uniref:hypothetical protein n=1 Tax=Pseudomonas aeruginosa TaxID=287 RepID=UPI00192256F1|nr:hypothetical protein [Pseudomonas aeruginosa]